MTRNWSQASGANIGELIEDLEKSYPGIKERLCDEEGNVRRFVNIFLNDEDIRFLEDKATAVKAGDEISHRAGDRGRIGMPSMTMTNEAQNRHSRTLISWLHYGTQKRLWLMYPSG